MSACDVEGQASENGEVGRGVVLAVARQILVEDDVERPMQAVFDVQWVRTMPKTFLEL